MARVEGKGRRARSVARWAAIAVAALAVGGLGWLVIGCGWDPTQPFMRDAPEVNGAIERMGAGDYEGAEAILATYLQTGTCSEEGTITLSERVKKRADGSFDLGLTLFHLGEKYGQRFGDEEVPGEGGELPEIDARRTAKIECALVILQAIAADVTQTAELRARAWYLTGNLEVLRREYENAVVAYEKALLLVPGIPEDAGGDGIGRDAAWNRAIALVRQRRDEDQNQEQQQDQEEKKPEDGEGEPPPDEQQDPQQNEGEQPQDQQQDPQQDEDQQPQGGDEEKPQEEEPKEGDGGGDEEKQDDGEGDRDEGDRDEERSEQMAPPPESSEPPRSRMLDDLREAPSYQEEDARREAGRIRRGVTMEDK